MIDFSTLEGFDWDKGNLDKNSEKHKVSNPEAEEVFYNKPLKVARIPELGENREERYQALGTTGENRFLSVVFTVRNKKIRVISARDMSRKERTIYYEAGR